MKNVAKEEECDSIYMEKKVSMVVGLETCEFKQPFQEIPKEIKYIMSASLSLVKALGFTLSKRLW